VCGICITCGSVECRVSSVRPRPRSTLHAPRSTLLRTVSLLLHPWPHVQTDAGHAAVRAGIARFLAARTTADCRLSSHRARSTIPAPCLCFLDKLPFLVLAIGWCVLTFLAQRPAMFRLAGVPFTERLANALVSYCRYLGKFFWPSPLVIFYPHPLHWPWLAV